jgi:hypothetical protein
MALGAGYLMPPQNRRGRTPLASHRRPSRCQALHEIGEPASVNRIRKLWGSEATVRAALEEKVLRCTLLESSLQDLSGICTVASPSPSNGKW